MRADRERDPFERRPGPCPAIVAHRQADQRAAQRRDRRARRRRGPARRAGRRRPARQPRPPRVEAFDSRRPRARRARVGGTAASQSTRLTGGVDADLGHVPAWADHARVVRDGEIAGGSLTTELRHVELPAISLTGPGAVTPAPNAHAMLSPAPATTGIVGGRPTRRTSAGRTARRRRSRKDADGKCAGSRPTASIRSRGPVRARGGRAARSRRPSSSRGHVSPVSARATKSVGWTNRRVAAKTSGSCARIHMIFAATWNAAGT